ncbi:hypothetical protein A8C32_15305 [Flavivirga aquatica]|uniref:tRNA_anti-like n=1 Tax=Flavivirga aquatica TaxID=1849968 RepID=A0A1E5T963_9FLAO|nr:hypothetical protein [Flavivirga aquatica]OEK07847.1 hypothetical protein A8C32_15305 [Flavivirga aquatica]
MYKRIILIIIVVLTMVFVYVSIYNKPHINIEKSTANISIKSSDLLNDFTVDETKANEKYLDKIIQVEGIISEISLDKEGRRIIALEGEDLLGNVTCYLSNEKNKTNERLKRGQSIIIKGICTGYLMDVVLVRCIIINT